MLKRILPPLIFAVAIGLVAASLARNFWAGQWKLLEAERTKLKGSYKPPIEVWVAKQDIAEGKTIAADDLALKPIPQDFVQPFATPNNGDLIGRIAVAPIAQGEQLLRNKVREPGRGPAPETLSKMTPKGMRAVTIGVDALSGVGGFVRPGDTVDLVWTVNVPTKDKQGEPVTLTLFQDVPVLAVSGQMVGQEPKSQPGKDTPQPVATQNTVTLALDPNQIALLLFARQQGMVQLSLRPPVDAGSQVVVAPANLNTVMEALFGATPEQPQPEPKPARQVEVYKGLVKDVVVLEESGSN
ncbi:MAG: Flp pilus assembly protein CpaB [Candidatus Omnitrophica bacterium]|nr:Flp pilus assembly protein CpaB [Candidatus Omnitrophota bacterium]